MSPRMRTASRTTQTLVVKTHQNPSKPSCPLSTESKNGFKKSCYLYLFFMSSNFIKQKSPSESWVIGNPATYLHNVCTSPTEAARVMRLICKAYALTAFGQGSGPCQQMYLRRAVTDHTICTLKIMENLAPRMCISVIPGQFPRPQDLSTEGKNNGANSNITLGD